MTEFDESNRGGCPGSAPHAALAAAKVAARPTLGAQRALPAARAQAATWPAVMQLWLGRLGKSPAASRTLPGLAPLQGAAPRR